MPDQHGGARPVCPLGQFGYQPRLADARLATDEHRATAAGTRRLKGRLQALQLRGAANEAPRPATYRQHAVIVPRPASGTPAAA